MDKSQAIRILGDILKYVEPRDPPEEHDAIQLGIEALVIMEFVEAFIEGIERDTDLLVMKADIFAHMKEAQQIICYMCNEVIMSCVSPVQKSGICDPCLEAHYPHLAEIIIDALGTDQQRYR